MKRSIWALILCVAGAACEPSTLTEATDPVATGPKAARLMDSSEFVNSGGIWGNAALTASIGSEFNTSLTAFKATSTVTWSSVSELSITTEAALRLNRNGATLNSTQNIFFGTALNPRSVGDTTIVTTVSLMNHKCGLTGKAFLDASAKQTLMNGTQIATTPWSTRRFHNAPDLTLADCRPPSPAFTMSGTTAYANSGATLKLDAAQSVNFDGSATREGDYPISQLKWYVGDALLGSGSTAGSWFEPGEYQVSLYASDAFDYSATAYGSISFPDTSWDNPTPGGDEDDEWLCWDLYLVWGTIHQYFGSICCNSLICSQI